MDDVPQVLSDAFVRTILEFGGAQSFTIDLRRQVDAVTVDALLSLGLGSSFAVITPFNPHGRLADAQTNVLRLELLRRRLDARGAPWVPADGISVDGMHRERGFAAGLKLTAAQALAAEFEQLALFWFDGRSFFLVPVLAPGPIQELPK